MIAGLSKAIILYLSPVLALTSVVLTILVFLAPILVLKGQVALLTVVPSTALTSSSGDSVDGPSVFLGILGSCSRTSNDASINCTLPTVSPAFDLSVLPSNAPSQLLTSPSASTPAFIAVSIAFSFIFLLTFTLISLRHKLGEKMSVALDKPMIQRVSAWIGFFGFIIGITCFLIIRMWFGKAVDDFNNSVTSVSNAPNLEASLSNGFTMAWVAYAFYGVPLVIALTKMHTTATK